MIDMKCPLCGEELLKEGCIHEDGTNEILWLRCDKCKIKSSDPRLWQELMNLKEHYACLRDTFAHQLEVNDFLTVEANKRQKALEIAKEVLQACKTRDHIGAICRTPEYVDKGLEKIDAILQEVDMSTLSKELNDE